MKQINATDNQVTGCLFIIGFCLVACVLAFGLGYLAAWIIHT